MPDAIDGVNMMYPAEVISVGNKRNGRRISQPAESLIVGPVFSKHIGPGKVCMLWFNYRSCSVINLLSAKLYQDRSRRISTLGLFC